MSVAGAPLKRLLDFLAKQDEGPRRREGFSISTLGICLAKQLFTLAGYPATTKRAPRMLLLWRLGMLIEHEVIALMQMAGDTIVGLQKEYLGANPPREGHVDGLLLRDGKLYIFDVKSANSQSFRKWLQAAGLSPWKVMKDGYGAFDPRTIAVKTYRPVREIYPAYYYQIQGYLELIRTRPEYQEYLVGALAETSPELTQSVINGGVPVATDGGYIFCYCKDDSSLYEEFIPADLQETELRLSLIRAASESIADVAPDDLQNRHRRGIITQRIRKYREYEPDDTGKLPWQCGRCDFKDICWENDAEGDLSEGKEGEESID